MYKVYNQRLAGFLMFNGNKLITMEANEKIPTYNIFIFEKNEKLTKSINEFTELQSKSKL